MDNKSEFPEKKRSFIVTIFLYGALISNVLHGISYLFYYLGIPVTLISKTIDSTVTSGILSLLRIVQAFALYGLLRWCKWGALLLIGTSGIFMAYYLPHVGSIGYRNWINALLTSFFWVIIVIPLWKNLE